MSNMIPARFAAPRKCREDHTTSEVGFQMVCVRLPYNKDKVDIISLTKYM